MHKLIVPTAAVALFSCGIDVETPEQESGVPRTGEEVIEVPGFQTESAVKPVRVVRPGERILIRISGKVLRVRVGKEYVKRVPSRWSVEECVPITRWDDDPYENCYESIERGVCEIRYRDFLGLEESPLEFLKDTEPPKIDLAIGGNTYRPQKIIHHAPLEMVLAFTVAPEMVPNGESAELIITPPRPEKDQVETIKTGFVGFGKCPNRTEKKAHDFTHKGHEIQVERPLERIEYIIDVIIESGQKHTKITHPEGGNFYA